MTVSDPAGIRHVLLDRADLYEKGRVQRRVLGPMLAQGMLLTEGEAWKRARRTVAPLFAPRRLAGATARMHAIAEARVEAWLARRQGETLDIDSEMTRLTFEMLSATLFSDEIGAAAAGFERAVNRYTETAARADPLDVMGAPDWIPRLGRILGGGAARWFENSVSGLVRARRRRLVAGEAPDDLLTALLRAQDPETGAGLSDMEVSSNILTFILAGHETTARALGWTFHLLSRSPEARARVEAEADTLDIARDDWVERAPWTRAVFEESMRLFPPAPVITRSALAEDEVCGVPVYPGTTLLISPWVLHRHQNLWEEPDAFRPERFLPGERERIDRFAYLPFGGGPRICVGATFAMQEAMLILAAVARRVRLDAVSPAEPTPTQRITLRAREGIRLKLNAR
ncbi:MAG: cytochrome P450 [Caulobacteraceae bacterium]|nr:cytochrome P450 [Caulobacteraceae bacterium]